MDMIFSVAKGIRHATMKPCSRATVMLQPQRLTEFRYTGSPLPALILHIRSIMRVPHIRQRRRSGGWASKPLRVADGGRADCLLILP